MYRRLRMEKLQKGFERELGKTEKERKKKRVTEKKKCDNKKRKRDETGAFPVRGSKHVASLTIFLFLMHTCTSYNNLALDLVLMARCKYISRHSSLGGGGWIQSRCMLLIRINCSVIQLCVLHEMATCGYREHQKIQIHYQWPQIKKARITGNESAGNA